MAESQAVSPESDVWTRDKLSGEWGGLRKTLEQNGVTISLDYTGELLADVAGGIKRGAIYEHEILGTVDIDLDKLVAGSAPAFMSAVTISPAPA